VSKSRVLVTAMMCVVCAPLSCDPSAVLLRSDALPFLREPLIEACCFCLADNEVDVGGPDEGCDAASGESVSPCLCDIGQSQCEDALTNGLPITVVGACVEPVGVCGDACSGTLAYP
jgi:hypothetical protein